MSTVLLEVMTTKSTIHSPVVKKWSLTIRYIIVSYLGHFILKDGVLPLGMP